MNSAACDNPPNEAGGPGVAGARSAGQGGREKTAYLTIDDGPTPSTGRKLDCLVARRIPAVLFCRGQAMDGNRAAVLDAIRRGFLIGNHSYDHPQFSDLTVEAACAQIRRTDAIIESIYAEAGVARPAKFFRFPYGDKGALTFNDVLAQPTPEGAVRKAAIQACLRELGYILPPLPGVTYPFWRDCVAQDVDWYWTYDVREWALEATPPEPELRTPADLWARMDIVDPARGFGLNSAGSDEVILTHDHAESDAIFEEIIARLQAKGLRFAQPPQ